MKCVFLTAAILALSCQMAGAGQKKVIVYGYDLLDATPAEVLANADKFDHMPIDGVIISSNGKNGNGRFLHHRYLMNEPEWDYDALDGEIDTLRQIAKHRSLRESLLGAWISTNPRLAWTDGEAWKRAAGTIAVLAHLAKLGGLKGLAVDAEDYHKSAQFYRAKNEPPYAELKKIVRCRGREFFKPMFDEYPEMTLFCFWILSFEREYRKVDNLEETATHLEDLLPSFINGMFDVMPKTVRFVDGDEHSYKYQAGRGEFMASAYHRLSRVLPLLAPEHRETYRARLSIANAIYMDAFSDSCPFGSYWYAPPRDGSRAVHLRECIAEAFDAADEYVWLYGEQGCWIDWPGAFYNKHYAKKIRGDFRRTWDSIFPGLYSYIGTLRNPKQTMLCIKNMKQNPADNLLPQLDAICGDSSRIPMPYGIRCDADKLVGEYGIRRQCGRGGKAGFFLKGTSRTCILATAPVSPGMFYVASVYARGGHPPSATAWLMTDGDHRFDLPSVAFSFDQLGSDGWRRGIALVKVPAGVTHIEINMGATLRESEEICFSDVFLCPLEHESANADFS